MSKNTSIFLGDYYNDFIKSQIESGKYSSASELVRAALSVFEKEETKRSELIMELKKGEKFGFAEDFDRETFLTHLRNKYQPV